jgi:hypothetical protein
MSDPDLVFDQFIAVGADPLEASALDCMVDLFGPVDDFAGALAEFRAQRDAAFDVLADALMEGAPQNERKH